LKIIFRTVTATNFRSFQTLTLDLDKGGLTLVQGKIEGGSETLESNGAGKSSIFSAISWALFGKFVHVSGLKVSGDRVVRRGSTGGAYVSVHLTTNTNQIIVDRYRSDPIYGDKIRLFVNGKEETQSSNPKTQQLIESLIEISFDLFTNLIYISEASLRESFAFESDVNRKRILVSALPQLQQFSKARVKVKDSLDKFDLALHKVGIEKTAYSKALEESGSGFEEVDLKEIQKRISQLETICAQHIQSIQNFKSGLNSTQVQLDELVKDSPDYETEFQELTAEISKAQQSLADLIAGEKTTHSQLQRWTSLGLFCPTCTQEVSEIKKLQNIRMLEEQLADFATKKGLAEKQLSDLLTKRVQVGQLKSQYNQQRDQLLLRLQVLNQSIAATESLSNARTQELQQLGSIEKNLGQARKIADQRQEKIRGRLSELETLLTVTRNFESALKKLLEGFGPRGALALGLNQVVEALTLKTERWLWQLWHEGANFQFGFAGDDLSKIEAKLFLNQELVEVESLSSGETRRLCLAICFGLREALQVLTGWQANLLILDESTDGVDLRGRSQISKLLVENYPDTSIFIVSQFQDHGESVKRVLTVRYSNGISRIVGD
jgi:DNA repair exonuclease SbcCD ATPase subunit